MRTTNFLKSRESYRPAPNTEGDSDTLGTITGSFTGAYWGIGGEKGLPLDWAARVEKSAYLHQLADRLYEAAMRKSR